MSLEHGRPVGGKVYLTSRQVRARYGEMSDMTLWRRLRDEELGFPQPIYVNNRRLWDAGTLDAFDRQRQVEAA